MEEVPVLLMPVSSIPAFRHRERRWTIEDKDIGLFQAMMPVVLANVLGLPAVTVPMAVSEVGVPLGIQLVGRPFEDELLMEVAIRLEESRGPFVGLKV
jgi:Asp-tRNA(Asn)/Glu-tRNA(Gln) amidotransferase A subunit family amidase